MEPQEPVPSQPTLLHGTLFVTIHRACDLPNMDSISESFRQCANLCKPCMSVAPNLGKKLEKQITSDPYVCVILGTATLARTTVQPNTPDPIWDESFEILVAHHVQVVEFVVKDDDIMGSQFIGKVNITAESLLQEQITEKYYGLVGWDNVPIKTDSKLQISCRFSAVEKDPLYRHSVVLGQGIPNTYFPLWKGCRVTLYQDAHVPDNMLPDIHLQDGILFKHGKCWEDIYQAIVDAHHLVYIVGWSIYTKTKLVRDGDQKNLQSRTLGGLLKEKAQHEAVRVLLLVWDDKTSHSFVGNVGVMGTHDEETRKFFKHSGVHCLLAPRYADEKVSWFRQKVVGTLYTHHQKIVIVDAQGHGNSRRLIAFLGGLDLCDGRYDTPEHPLFKNLNTTFADDYHNPTFPTSADSGGPRQPWHDLHCKVEGPAVYDVLKNFEQRWRKAAKWHSFRQMTIKGFHWYDKVLVDIDRVNWIDSPSKADCRVTAENDPNTWHAQIFRSIDSGSAKGFPKDIKKIKEAHLEGGKNIAIDKSIHKAYVTAIRSAKRFIYIENQYFIGSSYAWNKSIKAGANHLVPIELALKIVSKIKAREDFAVYVVIPMWPEGDPKSASVQEILYFQTQTMEMMYTYIAKALEEVGLEKKHPTDYLNFFCLGNREVKDDGEQEPSKPPDPNSIQAQVQKTRRFMIYVHAKGMIVDDEYVIIGSANINQRSLAGTRDTEIAIGAYQPHHTSVGKHGQPKGQVYGYRRSLWAEHLNVEEECFARPWSNECVKEVQKLAKANWDDFVGNEVKTLKGHLLLYPIQVESSGKIVALEDCDTFPDVGGNILGSSTSLPDNLTT